MRLLRARGGVEVGLRWADGRLIEVTLTPVRDGSYRVRAPKGQTITRASRAELKRTTDDPTVVMLTLKAGVTHSLQFATA